MSNKESLTEEEANELTLEHKGWAEAIAKSVARAWNLDWQLDGLDGAAFEALLFCARRYNPSRGVPFKGYARKRIHEASTEEARKSRGWKKGMGTSSAARRRAREVSDKMYTVFPSLRSGKLPIPEEIAAGEDGTRSAIQQMLIGASILSAGPGDTGDLEPEDIMDFKTVVETIKGLEPIHQAIMMKVYWEGSSLRSVASDWDTDELNVMREHTQLLSYLFKSLTTGKSKPIPKIRPALRKIALEMKKKSPEGPLVDALR